MWLEAVQPVKEIHQHLQSVLFAGLYHFATIRHFHLHLWSIFNFEVPLLERDGVVEEELWGVLEEVWEGVLGEIEEYGA